MTFLTRPVYYKPTGDENAWQLSRGGQQPDTEHKLWLPVCYLASRKDEQEAPGDFYLAGTQYAVTI